MLFSFIFRHFYLLSMKKNVCLFLCLFVIYILLCLFVIYILPHHYIFFIKFCMVGDLPEEVWGTWNLPTYFGLENSSLLTAWEPFVLAFDVFSIWECLEKKNTLFIYLLYFRSIIFSNKKYQFLKTNKKLRIYIVMY